VAASPAALSELFRTVDLFGVFANAVLGGIIARTLRLDPIGFAILALLSGLGGGLIRDTLLQHGTPIALTDYGYVLTALGGGAVAFLLRIEGRTWAARSPSSMLWRWAAGRAPARRRRSRSGSAGCPPSCSARSPPWAAASCGTW
jgi:hypothetical protein